MENQNEILKKLFYDPKFGILGMNAFKKKVRELHPEIRAKDIDVFYKNQETNQLTKKIVVNKDKYYKIVDVPGAYQIDIILFDKS